MNTEENNKSTEAKHVLGGVYLDVLKLHQGNDELRPWMTKPFYVKDLAVATDAHTMIWIDKNLVDGLEQCDRPNPSVVTDLMPKEINENFTIDVEKIKEAISKIKLVDDFDIVGESVKCSECDGDGEVEWEYENWTKDFECPKCDGEGYESSETQVKNGKKVIDTGFHIDIKQSRFSVEMILKLLKTQEILNAEEIILCYQIRPNASSVFLIGEAKVLCMPMQKIDEDKVVVNLA